MRRVITRRPWRLAAALALAAAALLVASVLAGDESRLRRAGSDAPVSAGARDLGDISANNSPTIVRNPRDRANLVVVARIDSPDFSCSLSTSSDGGRSWSHSALPIPPGRARKCYAPDAAFGADGTLHVSYVTLQGRGNTPSATLVTSSVDGGRTLSAPRRVGGALAFQVRISADPRRPRRLYVSWLQARSVGTLRFTGPGNPIVVSRSDDGGRSWHAPVRASAATRRRVLAPSTVVGPGGELYLLYLDVGEDRLDYEGGHDALGGPPYGGRFTLVLARSRDAGATWEESVVDDGVVPTTRFVAFLPPFPSIAVDPGSGRVHVAYGDARLGSADVWLWTLAPGAARWANPVRVNDTPRRDGTAQYLPRVAVAPGGRVDVVYYDRRGDAGRNLHNEVSLQSSTDGGRSFGAHVGLASSSFDARVGLGSERGLADLGSRLGLVSDDDGATAVWSDTRSGTDASLKQDLYAATARDGVVGLVLAVRYAGLMLGVLALALAGATLMQVWRRRAG